MTSPMVDLNVFTLNSNNLYAQTIITDFTAGEILINTPMNVFGDPDPMRSTIFFGRTKLNINGQIAPIQFKIEANNLQEALQMFPHSVKALVDQMHSHHLRGMIAQPARDTNLDLSKLKS